MSRKPESNGEDNAAVKDRFLKDTHFYDSLYYISKPSTSSWKDDTDGYLILPEEPFTLHHRYICDHKKLQFLGRGTFSKVYECSDVRNNNKVAVKIIKNIPKYRRAAFQEISVYEDLVKECDNDQSSETNHSTQKSNKDPCIIPLLDVFQVCHHIAMVFPKYDVDLYTFLNRTQISHSLVRSLAWQLCNGLTKLHHHGYIHTDLKPENIMLQEKKPKEMQLCIIDLGSAVNQHKTHSHLVTTRQYRSPEVLLGIPWDCSIDIWSLGCVLYEFFSYSHEMSQKTLFLVHDDDSHWKEIYKTIGKVPEWMTIAYMDHNRKAFEINMKSEHRLRDRMIKQLKEENRESWLLFIELTISCLHVDPHKRTTSSETLLHPFFNL